MPPTPSHPWLRLLNKPWLFLPAEWSHQIANIFLSIYATCNNNKSPPIWRPLKWKHLYFPNPLAPAGGIDKQAKFMKAWWAMGAGFIEIGTITPEAQKKNPGPSLKKNNQQQALWNNLGFPGPGVSTIVHNLKTLKHFKPTPIFANISKNRTSPNHDAIKDFLHCIQQLHPHVDAFVINISSPNTINLLELTQPQYLKKLLNTIQQELTKLSHPPKPFFIKWGPDLSERDFLLSLDIAMECGASGHIVCNSTTHREPNSHFPKTGGVSGRPLTKISKQRLTLIQKHLHSERKNQLLISTGGILTPNDVLQRLDMGADLIQVYSALVFQGPYFFRQVKKVAINSVPHSK